MQCKVKDRDAVRVPSLLFKLCRSWHLEDLLIRFRCSEFNNSKKAASYCMFPNLASLTGVHLMGVYLISVHLLDVYLISVYLMSMYLVRVSHRRVSSSPPLNETNTESQPHSPPENSSIEAFKSLLNNDPIPNFDIHAIPPAVLEVKICQTFGVRSRNPVSSSVISIYLWRADIYRHKILSARCPLADVLCSAYGTPPLCHLSLSR
jgi:hypothetical protein